MCVNWEKYGEVGNKYWLKAKNVGSGGKILIKGDKIWSWVADTHNLEKTSCAVVRFMNMIVNVKIWMRGGKIWKGGKNMGNRVKYWMCKENIPTFVEKY